MPWAFKTAFQSAEALNYLTCCYNSSVHEALVIDKLVSYLMHATLCGTALGFLSRLLSNQQRHLTILLAVTIQVYMKHSPIDKLVSYLMHVTLCVTLDMPVLLCLHVLLFS